MKYNIPKMKKTLKKFLDADRYEHTEGVMYTAASLVMAHGGDMEQALVAGLLHDCAKCIPDSKKMKLCDRFDVEVTEVEKDNPFLLHAKVGAIIAREKYGVEDQEILNAIACHTTGKPGMTFLDKIIYISDYIEPNRNKAPNLEDVRKLAYQDIDICLYKILSDTLAYLRSSSKSMDPMTLKTYNYYKQQMIDQE